MIGTHLNMIDLLPSMACLAVNSVTANVMLYSFHSFELTLERVVINLSFFLMPEQTYCDVSIERCSRFKRQTLYVANDTPESLRL